MNSKTLIYKGRSFNNQGKDVDWASRNYDGIKGKSTYRNQSSIKKIFDAVRDYQKSRQWD